MRKYILLITLSFMLTSNAFCGEKLFTLLRGKIVTNQPNNIQVVLTESDGSILDIAGISTDGVYKLDLTIMDTPSLSEVKKLSIEVKNNSGSKIKYPVKEYLEVSGDIILVKPFIFNK